MQHGENIMSKHKWGKWEYTDTEIDRQIQQATLEAQRASRVEPRAKAAYYDKTHHQIAVELTNGNFFRFDPQQFTDLANATPGELEKVEITPGGIGLHWEILDLDYRVPELAMSVLGTPTTWKRELARVAGKSRSQAKARAARLNGQKGGRPPTKAKVRYA